MIRRAGDQKLLEDNGINMDITAVNLLSASDVFIKRVLEKLSKDHLEVVVAVQASILADMTGYPESSWKAVIDHQNNLLDEQKQAGKVALDKLDKLLEDMLFNSADGKPS